jgi:hypothetical protein
LTAIVQAFTTCDDEFYYPKYVSLDTRLNKTLLLPDC